MTRLRLENVVQRHREERTGRTFEALRVRRLEINPGEMLSVVGPNGSGKSTLLETICFLNRPDEGRVLFMERDLWEKGDALAGRRRIPMLLQQTALFSTTVWENVLFGLRARSMPRAEADRRAREALDLVGMAHLAHRRSTELSGGERRRVALARVLALGSSHIVLDEPTAGLDAQSEQDLEDLILKLNRERGATIVMASHNIRQAVGLSSRIVTLLCGRLVPAYLDNLLYGRMHRVEGGFELCTHQGWALRFPEGALARNPWEGIGPVDGEVQVGISANSLSLATLLPDSGNPLRGTIDALHEEDQVFRVRLRLDQGPALYAKIPVARGEGLPLGLGQPVSLRMADQSIHVVASNGTGNGRLVSDRPMQ